LCLFQLRPVLTTKSSLSSRYKVARVLFLRNRGRGRGGADRGGEPILALSCPSPLIRHGREVSAWNRMTQPIYS
jgi:hypothetical protein